MRPDIRQAVVGPGAASLAAGALLVLLLTGPGTAPHALTGPATPPGGALAPGACVAAADTGSAAGTAPPAFYAIELVPTGNVTGTGGYVGTARVRFTDDSPFDVAVTSDGTFRRHLRVDMRGLRPAPAGDYVVWAAPPSLDPIVKLGALGEDMLLTGSVAFPKFLVVITLEEDPEQVEGRWAGPIVHRGMSRSGYLHTMAGHGPFQGEPCASYGFRR